MKTLKRYVECETHGTQEVQGMATCPACFRQICDELRGTGATLSDATRKAVKLPVREVWYNAKKDPTECDGRCMSATGGHCDCECGGKNHGKHTMLVMA